MYITVFLILSLVSVFYLKLAEKLNIVDRPNQRSSHSVPTIRGGGILFVVAFLLYQIITNSTEFYLLIAVLLIAVISFTDDIITLSAKFRFPFQVLAVTLMVYQVGVFNLSIWISLLVVFGCTGFINFYNFMDGINGITGIYSMAVLIGIYVVNSMFMLVSNELIIYEFLAFIVFGFYNYRKNARFFAGDIGSISISLILTYILLTFFYEKPSPIYILLIIVYGTDATLTLFYRLMIQEKITEAHRHHLYQKLVDRTNLSHIHVASLYAFLQLIIIGVIWYVLPMSLMIHYIVTGFILLLMFFFYCLLFFKMEK